MAAKNIIVNLQGNTITDEEGYIVGTSAIIIRLTTIEELRTEYTDGEISNVESNRFALAAFNPITGQQYNLHPSAMHADGSITFTVGVSGV